ncbi:CBS domain-containing protein [Photobacterium nomapromontoriensis]|uniref:CBS domain-containing protein n=1 Tax=Photobacterium nomapromontoriensis TaxID=2910237 RepID=UPI003D0B5CAE
MFTVADMMTPHPYTLIASNTLADAKRMMEKHHIRHIPITNKDNTLIGIISQRDILSAQAPSMDQRFQTQFIASLDTPIEQSMHRNLRSVTPNAGLKEAAMYMQRHHIGCLPIIDQDKLVGIITDSDFVSIAINLLELQEEIEPIESEYELY